MNIVIYDIEVNKNCFLVCLEDYETQKRIKYVISPFHNDFNKLRNHIESLNKRDYYFCGFNVLAFDAQVIHYILTENIQDGYKIYEKAQSLINLQDSEKFDHLVRESKLCFKNMDLFKIRHYDNKAKRTGLKWLEFTMGMDNVEEMPIHHTIELTPETLPIVEGYCWHDIKATRELLKRTLPDIDLRENLKQKYKLDCLNFNNGKIGQELLLKLYCEKTKKNISEVKKLKTVRQGLAIKNILFPYIRFKTPEFNSVLEFYRKEYWFPSKEAEFLLNYKESGGDSAFVYGYGGIHQCIESGSYYADDYYIILDCDVSSLYPSIAVLNNLYPEHLGIEFAEVYKSEIVDVRLAEKKKKEQGLPFDKIIVNGFKEAANITYGKSGEETSPLFDNKYKLSTTINGQLLLSMLVEDLYDIPDCTLLQTNTDGITLRFPRKYLDLYYEKCNNFMNISRFELEYAEYKAMHIIDVNNYIAVKPKGDIKLKGRFEIEPELHKNPSFKVIRKAIVEQLVHGRSYIDFIKNHNNIYDFLGATKQKSGFEVNLYKNQKGSLIKEKQQRITRFYVSNKKGGVLIKDFDDGRRSSVISDFNCEIANKISTDNISEYDINYNFYISRVREIISSLSKKQTLF